MVYKTKLYQHWEKSRYEGQEKTWDTAEAHKEVYDENLDLQKLINASMVEVCAEKDVPLEQVFFVLLFFYAVFITMSSPSNRVEEINVLCVKEIT